MTTFEQVWRDAEAMAMRHLNRVEQLEHWGLAVLNVQSVFMLIVGVCALIAVAEGRSVSVLCWMAIGIWAALLLVNQALLMAADRQLRRARAALDIRESLLKERRREE